MEATDPGSAVAALSRSSSAESAFQACQRDVSAEVARGLSTTAALAKEAASLFQSGSYKECLDVLRQILEKMEDNPKVIHNIAVAEYFRDGCTDPQKLLDVLSKVKRKSEDLAKAAVEQMGGINTSLSSPSNTSNTSGTRGNNTGSSGNGQALTGSAGPGLGLIDSVAYMDNYDTFCPTLNTAVILYHLQQYASALSVLEPLYQNIEPIDDTAALHACLLMLDIVLASRQPGKAAGVLQYMEKAFCSGFLVCNAETGSSVQSHLSVSSNTADAVSTTVNMSSVASSSVTSPNAEATLNRTALEEADEESLGIGLDIEGSNMVRSAAAWAMATNVSRIPVERSQDLNSKLLVHLYKVRLLLLTRNLKATKREVKLAMNLARGNDDRTALFLKAELEYSRGNYRKSIKLLTNCSSKEPGMTCMFLNNLGCIHHQLRKDQAASMFFLKALHSSSALNRERPLKLSMFSQGKSLAILYNCGMQQLRSGNPVLAFSCFQEAGCLYYNQPLLWLRLAECCISALEKGLLETSGCDLFSRKDELKVLTTGQGRWRRVILPDGNLNAVAGSTGLGLQLDDAEISESNFSNTPSNETDTLVPGKQCKLSMVFARGCLRNAAYLLDCLDAKIVEATAEFSAAELKDEGGMNNVFVQKNYFLGDSKSGTNGSSSLVTHASSNGNGKENKGVSVTSAMSSSIIVYEEQRRKENACITQFVLADLAFVELCLENPLKALKTAEMLLQQPECTKTFNFLGHMYVAEALCHLNRAREAVDHLSICMNESASIETSINATEDVQKWKSGENSEASGDGEDGTGNLAGHSVVHWTLPEALLLSSLTGTQARASLYVNLAAIQAMQGDLFQAHRLAMQAVSIMPAHPLAVLSVVYVDLLQGRTQEAMGMLKHCRHLCIINAKTGLKMN